MPHSPYDAPVPGSDLQTVRLRITGMHCAGCAAIVQKALARVEGVREAGVNFASAGALVTADPALVPMDRLVRVVRDAGYDVLPEGAAGADDADEAAAWRRRTIAAFACAAPLMAFMLIPALHAAAWRPLVEVALATAALVIAGGPFITGLWTGLRRGRANMDTLIAGGALVAWVYSAWEMLAAWREGRAFHGFFEVAAFILAFVSLGKWLEARARRRAGSAVRALLALTPESVTVRRGLLDMNVPLRDVVAGDRVVVRPGGRVPVDGVVEHGASAVDESSVTGEPVPVDKGAGDHVTSGTLNTTGALVIRAERVGADTVLARVAAAVERAQSSRAPVQRLADAVSAVFVPVVLLLALAAAVGWWLWTGSRGDIDWALGVRVGVAVLVISCPCALGLATPAAVVAAMGAAARRGLLIRDAATLEAIPSVRTVVFDKTGTLTRGEPGVWRVVPLGGENEEQTLALAASVEVFSEHPLARAIVNESRSRGIETRACELFEATMGLGVRGVVNGRRVSVERAAADDTHPALDELRRAGATVATVRVDDAPAMYIAMRDEVRPTARSAAHALAERGLTTIMLTGDHEVAARSIAAEVGIDDVISGVAPEGKADAVARIESQGRHVLMVGDGINDTPALARATVGVAMGTGADAAIESAGVVLMRPDPTLVPEAIDLAARARAIIRQNLALAIVYNAAMIPLAMLGVIHPALASLAMALSSVSVVTNALRLR